MQWSISRISFRLILALVLVGAAPAVFADQAIVKNMAAFDQAYIAALALSNQGKGEATLKAMNTLQARWKVFLTNSSNAFPGDQAWKAGLDKAGTVIAKAAGEAKAGTIAEVHETLEEIRAIFVTLRADRKVEYYIDYLNLYHDVMEQAAAVATGKSESSFSSADARTVAAILPKLQAEWKKARGATLDRDVYMISEAKVGELEKAMQATQASIDKLDAALHSGMNGQVYAAVNALKPAFTRSFLMFGKFES